MRALILFSLVVAIIAAAVWTANRPTSAGGPLYGDASCDGTVNSIDAAVILQHSAGLLATLNCPANADVNRDGVVNSLDASLVLQYAAGLVKDLGALPTATPTPVPADICPDGYYWNPAKGHCDSRECPPGLVFDEETLYCVLPVTPLATATSTPPSGATPVQHPEIYYSPAFWWHDTEIELAAGATIKVHATGSVIYDNLHLSGVTPAGDGELAGWGNCRDHSLVGWVGDVRPEADAPVSLTDVICLGADFVGQVPTSGSLHISINDRGGFDNNVGQWYVTVTTY